MSHRRYFIVTPVKNEEENLPNLIQSVVEQTIKPVLWVIIDDGSTDNAPNIIREAQEKYDWIQSIRLDKSDRDIGIHISEVVKIGFDTAVNYCLKKDIHYNYLGNVDGDMILKKSFFEDLIKEFEKNPKLGIACGGIQINDQYRVFDTKDREDTISGGEMICRKECFEDAGGIPISYSWENVLEVKAKLRGWEIKRFKKIKAIQTRETSSAEGLWRGCKIMGMSNYYLNYSSLIVALKGLKLCLFEKPHYIGIAYLLGYFDSLLQGKEQTNDDEIREYFFWYKPREIWQYYWNAFKNKLAIYSGGRRK